MIPSMPSKKADMQNLTFIIIPFFLLLTEVGSAQPCPDSASILHYIFHGDAMDLSGNDYEGSVFGAQPAQDRFGEAGQAYAFNGSSDYILTGYEPDLGYQDFSIEIWFKTESISPSPGNRLVSKGVAMVGSPAFAGYAVKLRKENGINEVRFSLGDEAGETVTAVATGIQENEWVHVVAVREENGMKVFLNGEFSASFFANKIFKVDTNLPLTLGRLDRDGLAPNAEYFHGSIDMVRIYDYALGEEEIDCLYTLDSDILLNNRLTEEHQNLSIFPNPVSDFLNLPEGKGLKYQLWSANGELVLTTNGEKNQMNLSHLPNGVYVVRIISKEGSYSSQILLKGND